MGITGEERAARERGFTAAVHSVEMEGGQVDDETQQQMEAYARGDLTAAQLREWTLDHVQQIADGER